MPRNLPLGNGNLLVAFDKHYQIRDLYWPHVGQKNHALGHSFRLGVWANDQLRWLDDPSWQRHLAYRSETMVSEVNLKNSQLSLEINSADVVDFHEDLLVRRFVITNQDDHEREVRLFFHQDFHIAGSEWGDTAYYEPERKAVIHYKGSHLFLVNGAVLVETEDQNSDRIEPDEIAPGYQVGVHGWSCGLKEVRDLRGLSHPLGRGMAGKKREF